MLSLGKVIRLVLFTGCLFTVGVSCTQADESNKNSAAAAPDMSAMMAPMMGMMNPGMYMNMMNPMMAPAMGMMNPSMMMNPMMGMNMMYPMMGMMNPSMMMNPMMGMNMMYPMMGMMGPMMNPMSSMSMPGMGGMGMHGSNPMSQMPGGQMMDPKQYEDWFKQWTEMMNNMTPQTQQTK